MTYQETRIKEPRHVVVYELCEVPALHVAVEDTEEESTDHRNNGSVVPLHQQRVDEHPARGNKGNPYSTRPLPM